jgi:hypothetical protein
MIPQNYPLDSLKTFFRKRLSRHVRSYEKQERIASMKSGPVSEDKKSSKSVPAPKASAVSLRTIIVKIPLESYQ